MERKGRKSRERVRSGEQKAWKEARQAEKYNSYSFYLNDSLRESKSKTQWINQKTLAFENWLNKATQQA